MNVLATHGLLQSVENDLGVKVTNESETLQVPLIFHSSPLAVGRLRVPKTSEEGFIVDEMFYSTLSIGAAPKSLVSGLINGL